MPLPFMEITPLKNKLWLINGRLIVAATAALCFAASTAFASDYTNFQTINNPGDANFNQLLGINNAGTIAGYFGDGTVVPNNGYTWTATGGFVAENVPGAVQTQVIGINNTGTTVGFSVDATGNNTGFVHTSTGFTTPITNPSTPTAAPTTNQLLGVNDHNLAAGFYFTSGGTPQGYIYNISSKSFTSLPGAVPTTATGINNAGDISGIAVIGGNNEGLYYNGKVTAYFEAPGSTNTGFFGLNNEGMAIGYYVDAAGLTHGLVYNVLSGSWYTVDDPNASTSTTPAFGVTGTTINGINDLGQLVGFYSDGTHVNGFLASTPEPASFGLMGLGALLGGLGFWRRRKQQKA